MERLRLKLAVIALGLAFVTLMVSSVYAQEPDAEVSIIPVVGAWLFYSLLGLLAAVSARESFNAFKFVRSLVWLVVIAGLAVILKVPPVTVAAQWGPAVNEIVSFLVNTGPFVAAIYGVDKLYKIAKELQSRLERLRAVSPPTRPPS